MLENSPVEFVLKRTDGNRLRFAIQIMDRRENLLLNYDFYSNDDYDFAFTPPKTDTFIVRLLGLSSYGEFDIKMNDFAFDSELRGLGNTIDVPATITPKIAKDSIAEYRFDGEANSPILFTLNQVPGQRFRYRVVIINSAGEVQQDYDFYSNDNYTYAFTPLSNDTYVIKITGLSSYGTTDIDIEQWITDTELKGAQNVVVAGDVMAGKLANKAVAEYRMMMTANAPIDFKFERHSKKMRFLVEIFDETGARKYSGDFYSNDEYRVVFTPLSSDVHTIRLTGLSSHGNYTIKLFDYD